MTIEEQLKQFILSKYSSLREFTIMSDIPYSTLDSILRRKIKNSGVSNILKICHALHISADALVNGKIVVQYSQETVTIDTPLDIEDILAETKKQLLTYDNLMFNGKVADKECINSILDAMDIALEMVKRKDKYKN